MSSTTSAPQIDPSTTSISALQQAVPIRQEPLKNKYDPLWYDQNVFVDRFPEKMDELKLGKQVPRFRSDIATTPAATAGSTNVVASGLMNNAEIMSVLASTENAFSQKIQQIQDAIKGMSLSQLSQIGSPCTTKTCVVKPNPFPPNGTIAIFDNSVQGVAGGVVSSGFTINDAVNPPDDQTLFTNTKTMATIEKQKTLDDQLMDEQVAISSQSIKDEIAKLPWLSQIRPPWFVTATCTLSASTTKFPFPSKSAYYAGEKSGTNTTSRVCTNFSVTDGNWNDSQYSCTFDPGNGLLFFSKKAFLILTFGIYFNATDHRNNAINTEQPTCFIILEEENNSGQPVHIIRGPEPTKCKSDPFFGSDIINPGANESTPVVLVGCPADTFRFRMITNLLKTDNNITVTLSAIEVPRKWAFENTASMSVVPPLLTTAFSRWTTFTSKPSAYQVLGYYEEITELQKPYQRVNVKVTLQAVGTGLQPDWVFLNNARNSKFMSKYFPSVADPSCIMVDIYEPMDQFALGGSSYTNMKIELTGTKPLIYKPHILHQLWSNTPTSRLFKADKTLVVRGGVTATPIDQFTIECKNNGGAIMLVDVPLGTMTSLIITCQVSQSTPNYYDSVSWLQIGYNSPSGRLIQDI